MEQETLERIAEIVELQERKQYLEFLFQYFFTFKSTVEEARREGLDEFADKLERRRVCQIAARPELYKQLTELILATDQQLRRIGA